MSTDPSSSSTSSGRLPPHEAARRAAEYLRSFMADAGGIRVEETELDQDDACWRITLSYEPGGVPFGTRIYKLFLVDVKTGEVLAMRMRKG